MSAKINLQKSPIPLDLIGSAVEVLKLIVEAASKRTMLKARVQFLENTDLTQAHQFVKVEERLDSLMEEVKMLRGVIRDITEKEIQTHFEKQASRKEVASYVPGELTAPIPELNPEELRKTLEKWIREQREIVQAQEEVLLVNGATLARAKIEAFLKVLTFISGKQ